MQSLPENTKEKWFPTYFLVPEQTGNKNTYYKKKKNHRLISLMEIGAKVKNKTYKQVCKVSILDQTEN